MENYSCVFFSGELHILKKKSKIQEEQEKLYKYCITTAVLKLVIL